MKGNRMKTLRTNSAEETMKIGMKLGSLLKAGDIVCLSGGLGTGKTAFTQGLARGLSIEDHITSPTFTIVNEYSGRLPLYHFDVYRISDPEEMFEIGFEEYLYGDGAVVIEWAELVKELLPEEYIGVTISREPAAGPDARVIGISFSGLRYEKYEAELVL